MTTWQKMSAAEAARELKTDVSRGLSGKEAAKRLKTAGENRLREEKKPGLLRRFFAQFNDFMVLILLAAAGVSYLTSTFSGDSDYLDSIIILCIVLLNALLGVIQESRAEKAIEALQNMTAPEARVLRDGRAILIPASEVVPGDVLVLETGDFVAADARLLTSAGLRTEESALTGESNPVKKDAQAVCPEHAPLAEQKNMVFASTAVRQGRGSAVVTATGMQTQVGCIAGMISTHESPRTPLQDRLAHVGKMLGTGALIICGIIFVMGLFQHLPPLDMFMTSISLAVAAIPEGLPAIVTIMLALGVRRMAGKRAVIRHLPAVETLGSASVICSDKTGTLTQNHMTVVQCADADGPVRERSPAYRYLMEEAVLCCNAVLETGKGEASGSPTEAAIVEAAAKAGVTRQKLDQTLPRDWELPFDSTRKLMSVAVREGYRRRQITKGAPDVLLSRCSHILTAGRKVLLSPSLRRRAEQQYEQMAGRALRVIAVAVREDAVSGNPSPDTAERELCFVGLIGMLDPPRPEVRAAVLDCRRAGIKPVMITGDHMATAMAIAKEIGILPPDGKGLTGEELNRMTDSQLASRIMDYCVFARVSPEHKVRIVTALQARGHVVAMTGDGVNDAPALKKADIGCAMGQGGTDVARGAADMVLADDNFATIVEAVREGRGIYQNIGKAVHFLLASNIGEILTVFVAMMMHLPPPLLAIQLLWVNLVTDSLPAIALGVDGADPAIMEEKPVNRKKSLFADGLGVSIALEGMLIGAISLLAYQIGRVCFDMGGTPVIGRTMAFAVLGLSQLVHAFDVRSRYSVFSRRIPVNGYLIGAFVVCVLLQVSVITVPALSVVFRTAALSAGQWLMVAGLSVVPMAVSELGKLAEGAFRRGKKR